MSALASLVSPILLSASTTSDNSSTSSYIILMVVLVAVMYFMMIRPQRKRQKEEQEMRSSLEIGDEIVTIGGIVGRVVTIREDDIVIETGADRTKMKLQRWAVNTNITKTEQRKKEMEAARQAAKDKKESKKKKGKDKTTPEEPKPLQDKDSNK
ncbi:MAG: preprotein translocase subunit YajC [Clostridiales bacterium]|nr:preprotein translocase subunit YajC [Clostridiales bacterium]